MSKVVVTGANGFVGKHLIFALRQQKDIEITEITRASDPKAIQDAYRSADIIYHLAGVNRPEHDSEFLEGNAAPTKDLVDTLKSFGKATPIVYSSSLQATVENAYGKSKVAAERVIEEYSQTSGASCAVYRLKNIFGSRCRPHYNSVVATYCYSITRSLPITVNDPNRELELVWVGDVVKAFLTHLPKNESFHSKGLAEIASYKITLQDLSAKLYEFSKIRENGVIPDMSDRLMKLLHSTFISYYPVDNLAAAVDMKTDPRGSLFELIRSKQAGQIFVSTTKPGITRGNHHHVLKIEKFCVIQGEAEISFRDKDGAEVYTYHMEPGKIRILDIPPGYTHKIVNIGSVDLITIFWANEPFDSQNPDTHFEAVEL